MLFLHLGFGLGALVTEGIHKVFQSFMNVQKSEDFVAPGQNNMKDGQENEEPEKQIQQNPCTTGTLANPAVNFCRFSNSFNNCWFSSVMQSVLNLRSVSRVLSDNAAEDLCAFTELSLCARFLLSALRSPGRFFSPAEMFPALEELDEVCPSLPLSEQNDAADFMEPLMNWLEFCGVQSVLVKKTRCTVCRFTSTSTEVLGHMYFLPNQTNFTSNLFTQMEDENGSQVCEMCASKQTQVFFNSPDVINLYQARLSEQGIPRTPVHHPESLIIPTQTGTASYRLSSVICHIFLGMGVKHDYTYVFSKGQIVIANDSFIHVAPDKVQSDIQENGVLYVYEKCTEE